jgi:recombination protein RecT
MPDESRELATSNRDLATMPLQEALDEFGPNFAAELPSHIPLARFKRTIITAINSAPDLRYADRRSLFNACVKCAHDGLYPDGREAALVVFKTKVKDRNGNERTIDQVQYMPMIAGIRKRLRNSGEVLSAIAEVVHRHDKFRYAQGEQPVIEHEPPPLDQDRGDMIGAYAIIKLTNGEVLREVMPKADIEKARKQSRAPNSLMWREFWGEGARKTVLRRCAKAAPVSSELERLLARDDELPELPAPETVEPLPPRPTREQFIASEERPEPEPVEEPSEPEEEEEEHEEPEDEPEPVDEPVDEPADEPFVLVDAHGEEHRVDGAANAAEGFRAAIEEAGKIRADLGISAVWDNNESLRFQLRERGYDNLADELGQFYSAALAAADAAPAAPSRASGQAPPAPAATTPPPPKKTTQRPPTRAATAAATPAATSAAPPEVSSKGPGPSATGEKIAEIKPQQITGRSGWDWKKFADDCIAAAQQRRPDEIAAFRVVQARMLDTCRGHPTGKSEWSRIMQALAELERA